MAKLGLGLAYAFEPMVMEELRSGQLQRVLEPYAPTVPVLLFVRRRRRARAGESCGGLQAR
ncbi:hypothetical protein [Hyalangium minutum]|uniref:Transcriptional regulator, LysR family protein n=1 Tax=Hyalangium minutum TaxID=394096 RepID=A0A085WUU4_9BACT|nr:Transcriptional regulator, LysR family protein [Hyalangium minutum]